MAYTTEDEVRAHSEADAVGDAQQVTSAKVAEAIAWAEALIDDYCGTSFEAKAFAVTLDGNGCSWIQLVSEDGRLLSHPRSLTSVTIDGEAVADTSAWVLRPDGTIVRPSGTFPTATGGQNVVIAGTAGLTTAAPTLINRAAQQLARQYCLEDFQQQDPRALTITDELGGQTMLATPGRHGPTSIPAVNDILKRYRRRPPAIA